MDISIGFYHFVALYFEIKLNNLVTLLMLMSGFPIIIIINFDYNSNNNNDNAPTLILLTWPQVKEFPVLWVWQQWN